MLHWLINLLYSSTDAEFESRFSLEESVARLKRVTSRFAFCALTCQRAVGPVRETRVSLQRVIPFVGNSFKPFFIGRFVLSNQQVKLTGRFTMSRFVRIFMSLWFGFCILLWIGMMVILITRHSMNWWFPFTGLGMFCCGIALVWTGKWFARNDPAWLSEVIKSAFSEKISG